jgi:hypothetical protein
MGSPEKGKLANIRKVFSEGKEGASSNRFGELLEKCQKRDEERKKKRKKGHRFLWPKRIRGL